MIVEELLEMFRQVLMNNNKQRIKSQVKESIPKDWLCDIRIIYRIVMEAVNDLKRTGLMNIVIITANENYTFIVDAVNCTAAGQGIFSDIYVAISVEHSHGIVVVLEVGIGNTIFRVFHLISRNIIRF